MSLIVLFTAFVFVGLAGYFLLPWDVFLPLKRENERLRLELADSQEAARQDQQALLRALRNQYVQQIDLLESRLLDRGHRNSVVVAGCNKMLSQAIVQKRVTDLRRYYKYLFIGDEPSELESQPADHSSSVYLERE